MTERRVLVTGASRGIGRAIARRLGGNGWMVAVHFNQASTDAESLREELKKAWSGSYQADLGRPGEVQDFAARVLADGPLEALVNNAGIYIPMEFLSANDAEFELNWSQTLAVNFESPVRLIRALLPGFVAQGGGRVLNVASRVGFKSEAGAALYAASKAALINLTRSLAAELAPHHVGIFGIAPGWVETAMTRGGMEDRVAAILPTIPLGRMASVEDCAAVANFLLSDEAAYLSGQVIDINGASYFH